MAFRPNSGRSPGRALLLLVALVLGGIVLAGVLFYGLYFLLFAFGNGQTK